MKITVEDRRAVSAEVTVEMVEGYLRRIGCEMATTEAEDGRVAIGLRSDDRSTWLPPGPTEDHLRWIVEAIARDERRHPSEVLSDMMGYRVGLDRGRAMNLRATARARVVEAREALVSAETELKAKPKKADRIAAAEAATQRLAQAEADLAAVTRALEAATVAAWS